MSGMFLLIAISDFLGKTSALNVDFMYVWALFSIADALWINLLWRK